MSTQMRFLVVFCFFLIFGCSNGTTKKSSPEAKSLVSQNVKTVALELSITGMSCAGCEETVQSGLSSLKGVKKVKANYRNGKAYVEILPDIADTVQMKETITTSGYALAGIRSIPLDSLRAKL